MDFYIILSFLFDKNKSMGFRQHGSIDISKNG